MHFLLLDTTPNPSDYQKIQKKKTAKQKITRREAEIQIGWEGLKSGIGLGGGFVEGGLKFGIGWGHISIFFLLKIKGIWIGNSCH